MKEWYKSKTVWLAFAQGAAGVVLALYTQYPEAGGLLMVKSALDLILRILTTQPLM